MAIPVSDREPTNRGSGPGQAAHERIHPGDVLGDWFDDSTESAGHLADKLAEAYEGKTVLESSGDDLATIAVDVVQRHLRDYAAAIDPADVAGLVDPRAALADWFSDGSGPLCEPFSMLAVAFETSADEHSSSGELADIAVDTIQRYLRDCAAEVDG